MSRTFIAILLLLTGLLLGLYWYMFSMPGDPHQDTEVPPLTDDQKRLREQLQQDVDTLAGEIGIRSLTYPDKYRKARQYIESQLKQAGFAPKTQRINVDERNAYNIVATKEGSKKDDVVVIGAHYDTTNTTAGADDNASGVAGVLALARRFQDRSPDKTIRFVFFANEEPPYFQTPNMGSFQYAKKAKAEGENIVAMISLGCWGITPMSQIVSRTHPVSVYSTPRKEILSRSSAKSGSEILFLNRSLPFANVQKSPRSGW